MKLTAMNYKLGNNYYSFNHADIRLNFIAKLNMVLRKLNAIRCGMNLGCIINLICYLAASFRFYARGSPISAVNFQTSIELALGVRRKRKCARLMAVKPRRKDQRDCAVIKIH